MYPTVSVGPCLAALLICLPLPVMAESPAPNILVRAPELPAAPVAGSALVDRLDTWLDAHVDLPRRDTPPTIRRISAALARETGGTPKRGYGAAGAFYDPDTATISLVDPWSATSSHDVSVLLHEFVHHRQVGRGYACQGAEEMPAYRAQADWLAERGLELDVNWIAIVLDAGCTPRDIHPD